MQIADVYDVLEISASSYSGLANVCLVASVTAYFIDATSFKLLGGIIHFWF
jgi:hypothetical protein